MKKKLPSLRISLVVLIAACWLVPIAVFSYFIFHSYKNAYIDKSEKLILNGVKVAGVLVSNKMEDGIHMIQEPTYEGYWERCFDRYESGEISRGEYLAEIKTSLKSKFYSDERFSDCAFYIIGEENSSTYFANGGLSFHDYSAKIQPKVDEIRKKDSNYVEVLIIEDNIYLVRNLYTVNKYRKYGTLVVGLNKEYLFKEIPMENPESIVIGINDGLDGLTLHTEASEDENKRMDEADNSYKLMQEQYAGVSKEGVYKYEGKKSNGYMYQNTYDDYKLSLYYNLSQDELFSSLRELYKIVFIILIALIPGIFASYFFLTKNIDIPLKRLVEASKKIHDGKFGSTVERNRIPNEEFDYLTDSFNAMSEQVKYLFDSVYTEQMARKDAQIAALQAQINPHFLNNTLEMMNWQARMNQDIETSKMIEAIGTVLDFSINRTNNREIYLSEELRCADSYLYIMSMRFGQRLKVEKVIDQYLLQSYVPQLILQPLLENAIKHGIEKVNTGIIYLNIYQDGAYRFIDVINTGKKMTDFEMARITQILEGTYHDTEPGNHTSIGIYNINRRIKLIYGNEYGLTITQYGENKIVSRIILPIEETTKSNLF